MQEYVTGLTTINYKRIWLKRFGADFKEKKTMIKGRTYVKGRKLQNAISSQKTDHFEVYIVLLRQFYSTDKCYDAGQPTPSTHPQLLKEGEITPGITCDEYISRRKRLLELLPEQSVAIVAAAPVKMMTDVVPYNFRQDADYLYITGCQQPGGIAVLGHDFGLCMFMPEATPQDITWQGQIAGIDAATEFFKADQSYPISKLHKFLPNMIKSCSKLYHNVKTAIPTYTDLEAFQKASYNGGVHDFSLYTHEARWALLQTMLHSKISPYENILSAKVEYECRMRGAQRMAFNPVVGGGLNGSVIHYSRNDQKVKDGDLVLMDVGCELHGYVSDLTRTWPPCGSFSDVHKELYDLVVETNKECIELCKPGASIQHVHNYSVNKLFRGLKEIGILKDNRLHSYHQLNPTSIGHYLGMDVHDCSKIGYDRTLKPGVVLTGSLPKEINHIETLLNNHSYGGTFASSLIFYVINVLGYELVGLLYAKECTTLFGLM
ncbi:Aminopeptidase P N-terminal domain-containing protein, partial [Cynara cardunculus var. scolymus]